MNVLRNKAKHITYSKTCVKETLSKIPKIGFQDRLSLLNAGQKYCRMLQWHSAMLSTFIKVLFVIKRFILSIFELPFYTGFTVLAYYLLVGRKTVWIPISWLFLLFKNRLYNVEKEETSALIKLIRYVVCRTVVCKMPWERETIKLTVFCFLYKHLNYSALPILMYNCCYCSFFYCCLYCCFHRCLILSVPCSHNTGRGTLERF